MENNISEIKEFYNGFLKHLKMDHERPNARQEKIKTSVKQFLSPQFRVLDLGCGTGISSKFIADHVKEVVAVDLSDKLIEYAKENSSHPKVQYMVHDIVTLDLKEEFDLICLIDVFEHIPKNRIQDLIITLNKHAGQNTGIYINLPDARFSSFLQSEKPSLLQIVDEAYFIEEIAALFKSIDYEIAKMEIYGIDLPVQYNDYFLVNKHRLSQTYGSVIK